MQRDDTYKDLSGKGKEAGMLTNANVSYKGTATLTEMQAITDREYRALFESMEQGVLGLDSDGRIIMANPAAQAMLGYSFEELQERTTFDPRWQTRRSDGSDFPDEEHPVKIALRTGKQVNNVTMGLFQPGH